MSVNVPYILKNSSISFKKSEIIQKAVDIPSNSRVNTLKLLIFFSKERNVRHNVKIQVVSEKNYMMKIKAKFDVNFCHVCQTNNFRPL